MKVQVVCKVPTTYQSKSIKVLCGSCRKNPDGSLTFQMDFDTKVDAKQWLYDRAYELAGDNKELKSFNSEIRVYDQLTYDAATVKIKPIKRNNEK
jgi:hypothetical protein